MSEHRPSPLRATTESAPDGGSAAPGARSRHRRWQAALLLGLLLVLAWSSFVIVPETETAIITLFGSPRRTLNEAGLYWKWPFESRLRFEKRILLFDPLAAEFLTADKKNLVIDSAVCWRIHDARRFLEAAGDTVSAEMRLRDIVWADLAAAVGQVALSDLVAVAPQATRVAELVENVRAATDRAARQRLGIEVLDVQLTRLSFPEQNREAVFARMRAERERIAREYRAQGEEMAIKIRAAADREREVILAQAYREAERLKGEGDAEATRIYGEAYARHPAFYKFVRTLESYQKILDEDTTVILSSDSELLELLTKGLAEGARP
jgi:membrane protease subunit HflC